MLGGRDAKTCPLGLQLTLDLLQDVLYNRGLWVRSDDRHHVHMLVLSHDCDVLLLSKRKKGGKFGEKGGHDG